MTNASQQSDVDQTTTIPAAMAGAGGVADTGPQLGILVDALLAERYRRVLETSNDAIVITDRNRCIAFTNPAADVLFGLNCSAIGRPLAAFIAPELQDWMSEIDARILDGQAQRYETTVVRSTGERRTVAASSAPLRDAEGRQVAGIVASLRDVTDERRARDAAVESEARYTRLVEVATDAIFTVDPDGRLTAVNRSLERSTGRYRRELLGTPFSALIDSRDHVRLMSALENTFSGRRQRLELRYRSASVESRHCSLMLTPLYDGERLTGALGIARDVTDERRLVEQLVQQEKLAAVGQLVSGVAHELNNPLAGVIAFSQMLAARTTTDAEQRQAVEAIEQEARRAAKIVSNLLTFARQHKPERRVADINRVIADSVDLRRYALHGANIDIETRLDPDLPITWADPFQLQQVVINLITNAEHAISGSTRDLPERRITVSSEHRGNQIVACVSDTGPGIAAEHISRIFNPFFTTKAVGEGTGLGLSIADGILREHGGRIRVESRIGEGATFILELPIVVPPSIAPSTSITMGAYVAPETQQKRILVVDEESEIRCALAVYLGSLGHLVDVTATVSEALHAVAVTSYDAIVLDMHLRDGTGRSVLEQIETIVDHRTRVVLVATEIPSVATCDVLDRRKWPFVMKPLVLDDIAELVLTPTER